MELQSPLSIGSQVKVRLNADLSEDAAEALKHLARIQNITLAEALTRAIGTESFLVERRKRGARVILEHKGKMSELTFAS